MKIFKYSLAIEDEQTIKMPKNAKIIALQTQHEKPCLWAMVEPSNDIEERRFFVFGTGHNLYQNPMTYIGSFQTLNGQFVGHVFEADNGLHWEE